MSPPATKSPAALREAWDALRERTTETDVRRAAVALEVSEAELLATRCGHGVRRIEADVERLLPRLEALGPLVAVTRNPLFVHEKIGAYEKVYLNPHVSSVVGGAIDLRIFPGRWAHGFAVEGRGIEDRGPSLRFFDPRGRAVHEILSGEDTDPDGWAAVVEDLLHPDQGSRQEVEPGEPPAERRPDEEVDVTALEADWRELEDTHDFLGMLREHDVSRTQALRLVSDELARPARADGVRRILETASEDGIELMVFVRSSGTIQIHHGPVRRIEGDLRHLQVRDPGFHLQVSEDGVAGTWVVKKPVETGWVTSVEVYDGRDTLCAHFFGCREEGQAEDRAWRRLAEGLA